MDDVGLMDVQESSRFFKLLNGDFFFFFLLHNISDLNRRDRNNNYTVIKTRICVCAAGPDWTHTPDTHSRQCIGHNG